MQARVSSTYFFRLLFSDSVESGNLLFVLDITGSRCRAVHLSFRSGLHAYFNLFPAQRRGGVWRVAGVAGWRVAGAAGEGRVRPHAPDLGTFRNLTLTCPSRAHLEIDRLPPVRRFLSPGYAYCRLQGDL